MIPHVTVGATQLQFFKHSFYSVVIMLVEIFCGKRKNNASKNIPRTTLFLKVMCYYYLINSRNQLLQSSDKKLYDVLIVLRIGSLIWVGYIVKHCNKLSVGSI